MKKLLLILLFLPMIGFGQEWIFDLGNYEEGHSVKQTTDGGYIITGRHDFGNGSIDVFLLKTDGSGNELWTKTFVRTGSDNTRQVQQTTDGGYIIMVSTTWEGVSLIKTNANGDSLWTKTFEVNCSHNVFGQQTSDGGYIISSSRYVGIDSHPYIVKTDSNGDSLWTKTFYSFVATETYVQQTTDGGYIIATENNLIKIDGNGVEQWYQTIGLNKHSVQQTTDGGYIFTGGGTSGLHLVKTDAYGIIQWTRYFGTNSFVSEGLSVVQTTDGGYIITGLTFPSPYPFEDVYLIKTDGNGNELWTKTFGGTDTDYGQSVQQTTDGGYIITGRSVVFSQGHVYLIKTDGNGTVTSTFNIPINPNRKLQKTIDILGKETKPKTNQPLFYIYDDGTVEKRIVIE